MTNEILERTQFRIEKILELRAKMQEWHLCSIEWSIYVEGQSFGVKDFSCWTYIGQVMVNNYIKQRWCLEHKDYFVYRTCKNTLRVVGKWCWYIDDDLLFRKTRHVAWMGSSNQAQGRRFLDAGTPQS